MMCIAILQPSGASVTEEVLRRCWARNPHGGGFMYSNGSRMIVVKELRSADHFIRHVERHAPRAEAVGSPMVYHFRWATHGKQDLRNCHPFLINNKLGFAHNGTFSWIKDNKVTSDTYVFNQGLLKHLPDGFILNSAIMTLIDDYVGYNKLVFLDANFNYAIVNESSGEWSDGIWYSNTGYRPFQSTTSGTSTGTTGVFKCGTQEVIVYPEKDREPAKTSRAVDYCTDSEFDEWWLGTYKKETQDCDGHVTEVDLLEESDRAQETLCDLCGKPILTIAAVFGDNIVHKDCYQKILDYSGGCN